MKLEEGKFYKTRDGHKVFIYKAYNSSCVHGAYYTNDDEPPFIDSWDADGFFDASKNHWLDIVAEWKEPFKLEDGKFYKTRDGRKVEILKPWISYPGVIYESDGSFDKSISWREAGECPGIDGLEIISEWKEPFKFEVDVRWSRYEDGPVFPWTTNQGFSFTELAGKKGKLIFEEDV